MERVFRKPIKPSHHHTTGLTHELHLGEEILLGDKFILDKAV